MKSYRDLEFVDDSESKEYPIQFRGDGWQLLFGKLEKVDFSYGKSTFSSLYAICTD